LYYNSQRDFGANITEDKEGHFRMMKGPIHQEDLRILNVYAPNKELPNTGSKILQN
jgi:hypothetical protein